MLTDIIVFGVIMATLWMILGVALWCWLLSSDVCVFISYRRDETGTMADRLYDDLAHEFGKHRVFKDNRSDDKRRSKIREAFPWLSQITRNVYRSHVMLVMMGNEYLTLKRSDTNIPRISEDGDVVRYEVEKAIEFGTSIFPILVNQDNLPQGEFPKSIADLSKLQAFKLKDGDEYADQSYKIIVAVKEKTPKQSLPGAVWSLYFMGVIQLLGFAVLMIVSWLSTQEQLDGQNHKIDEQNQKIANQNHQISKLETRLDSIEKSKVLPYSFQQVCDMVCERHQLGKELIGLKVIWIGIVVKSGKGYFQIKPKKESKCEANVYPSDESKIEEARGANEVIVFGTVAEVHPGEGNPLFRIKGNCTIAKLK